MMSSSRFVIWLLSIVLLIALARTPVLAQELGADFGGVPAPSNGNGLPAAKPTLPPQSPLPFPPQFPAGAAVLPDLSPPDPSLPGSSLPGPSSPDFPPALAAPSWPSTANGPLSAAPPGGEIGTPLRPVETTLFQAAGSAPIWVDSAAPEIAWRARKRFGWSGLWRQLVPLATGVGPGNRFRTSP